MHFSYLRCLWTYREEAEREKAAEAQAQRDVEIAAEQRQVCVYLICILDCILAAYWLCMY